MTLKDILKELKRGIKETSKYVFSHHKKENYYKCYLFKLKNHQIAICSRCLGIYLGIAMGVILFSLQILNKNVYYYSIAFFPIFIIIDWSISAFTKYKSNNLLRTTSGMFLGVAYAFGLILFFKTFPNYFVIIIGFFYLILTLLLILIKEKYIENI